MGSGDDAFVCHIARVVGKERRGGNDGILKQEVDTYSEWDVSSGIFKVLFRRWLRKRAMDHGSLRFLFWSVGTKCRVFLHSSLFFFTWFSRYPGLCPPRFVWNTYSCIPHDVDWCLCSSSLIPHRYDFLSIECTKLKRAIAIFGEETSDQAYSDYKVLL